MSRETKTLEGLSDEAIMALNIVGNKIGGIRDDNPTQKEVDDARKYLLSVFIGNKRTYQYYIRNVFMAIEYAQSHCCASGNTLLDDIISKKHDFTKMKEDEIESTLARYIKKDR